MGKLRGGKKRFSSELADMFVLQVLSWPIIFESILSFSSSFDIFLSSLGLRSRIIETCLTAYSYLSLQIEAKHKGICEERVSLVKKFQLHVPYKVVRNFIAHSHSTTFMDEDSLKLPSWIRFGSNVKLY